MATSVTAASSFLNVSGNVYGWERCCSRKETGIACAPFSVLLAPLKLRSALVSRSRKLSLPNPCQTWVLVCSRQPRS